MEDNNKNQDLNRIKRTRQLLRKLTEIEGFYIILFICICIVATTAVWVSSNNVRKLDAIQDKDETNLVEDIELNDDYLNAEDSNIRVVGVNDITQSQDTGDEKTHAAEGENTEENGTKVVETAGVDNSISSKSNQDILKGMVVPLKGNISMDYAEDKLVYSKTLEQWTTHLGLDISAKQGSIVRAALDGVVSEVKKGTELGIIITLDHGNGIQTKYANVSTDEMVKIGQKIKKGVPISGVGKGTSFEMVQGPHLHFEVIIDGKNVNPKTYLPKFK